MTTQTAMFATAARRTFTKDLLVVAFVAAISGAFLAEIWSPPAPPTAQAVELVARR